jgi:hypothetical protein
MKATLPRLMICVACCVGSAHAACPRLDAPQPINAEARAADIEVVHAVEQKVEREREVPVHAEFEIRIVASEPPPAEERHGLVGQVNEVARAMEARIKEEARRHGFDIPVDVKVTIEVTGVEAQLQREGFVRLGERSGTHEGRAINATMWGKRKITTARRIAPVSAGTLEVKLLVRARACIDEAAGKLNLEPRVRHHMRSNLLPDAGLSQQDVQSRMRSFEAQVRSEAERVRVALDTHVLQFDAQQRELLGSRSGQPFAVQVPFTAFGQPQQLAIEVTPLMTPRVNRPLGEDP